jgi:osmotically-inducible protein OsmY
MKFFCALMMLASQAEQPAQEPPARPQGNPPPKKETTEGNSDLQKLSPTILNELSRRIETALIGDTSTGTLGFRVGVEEQMIVISGDAPDEESRKRASEIATGVANDELYRIVNKIRIKPAGTETGSRKAGVTDAPTAPDLAQLERIDAVLRDKLPDLSRTIRAKFRVDPMPSILLEGVVDTMEQKVEVSRVIRSEVKSLPLLNNIQLRIKPNMPTPRPAVADKKQARSLAGPQNKAVALDSDTREEEIPTASALANKIMGDSRIWDTVVLIQMDGGLCWLKGTVETFQHKVRVVNHAERMIGQGVTYVIDDLTVAQALRGAQELSTARNTQAPGVETDALVAQDAVVYFKRYLRDSVPALGSYVVEPGDTGTVKVVLKGGVRSAEEMKRISDAVQKMGAELGVKAVVDVQGNTVAVPPPQPAP